MANINYWIDALNGALKEVGESQHFTAEQKILMAHALVVSAENESMADGSLCAPHPKDAARETERARLIGEIKEEKGRAELYKKALADKLGIAPSAFYVDRDGRVQMYR